MGQLFELSIWNLRGQAWGALGVKPIYLANESENPTSRHLVSRMSRGPGGDCNLTCEIMESRKKHLSVQCTHLELKPTFSTCTMDHVCINLNYASCIVSNPWPSVPLP